MGNITFTIVSSNYTGGVFAWGGTPETNKKYLGNREVMGAVSARNEEEALAKWRASLA